MSNESRSSIDATSNVRHRHHVWFWRSSALTCKVAATKKQNAHVILGYNGNMPSKEHTHMNHKPGYGAKYKIVENTYVFLILVEMAISEATILLSQFEAHNGALCTHLLDHIWLQCPETFRNAWNLWHFTSNLFFLSNLFERILSDRAVS